jgi:hypothetical protein
MPESKIATSYREIFFFLFFAIMFGMRMWGVYEGTSLYAPLLVAGFLFWAISVAMTRHTMFEYAVIAAFMALALLVYINSKEKGLLLYFALMLGMKGIDIKKLFKVGLVVGGVGMACLTFLSAFGIIEDVAYVQERSRIGLAFRHSLGMPHPNTLSTSFIIISVMVMYVVGHEDKLRVWLASVIITVIAFYLYLYSGSRTGIATNIGILALNLIYTYRRKTGILEKAVLVLLFPALWCFSIVLPAVASYDLIHRLMDIDFTLFSRLEFGKYYLETCPITLFGTVVFDEAKFYGVDMAQLFLFLNLGLVAFAVVSVLNVMLVVDEVKENRLEELVITFSFLVMGMTDPFLYNISFKNLCFVFMGAMLYRRFEKLESRLPAWMAKEICLIGAGDKTIAFGGAERQNQAFDGTGRLTQALDGEGSRSSVDGSGNRKTSIHSDGNNPTSVDGLLSHDLKTWAIAIGCSLLVAAAVALIQYIVTPDPSYVLADNGKIEHVPIEDIEGRTYTRQEIKDIQSQGNIVLNYSGEDELMYAFYSDENSPVQGGVFSGKAAQFEKLRRSISVFFWGTAILAGIVQIVGMNHRKSLKKGIQSFPG